MVANNKIIIQNFIFAALTPGPSLPEQHCMLEKFSHSSNYWASHLGIYKLNFYVCWPGCMQVYCFLINFDHLRQV